MTGRETNVLRSALLSARELCLDRVLAFEQFPLKPPWVIRSTMQPKYTGQTPTSFVHDGWASARLPFNVRNRYGLAVKAVLFLSSGFWAPFLVCEYQLRKANQ
ncbi:hypothetical protein QR680_013619 [Steinernema hermaphroditum]|uniref:Cytochrome c oxidase polypeptide VIIc n=1 Tax=Steinernema hermaphroditum TaxID=289476 RepID=A0AA39M1U4_9BILA|nr:hypothetical protein QR680_013619 [Steinernema hermaphroditum]